jgi:predicted alpha/beta hydrolase
MKTASERQSETHRIQCGDDTANARLFRAEREDAPCVVIFPALGTPSRPYRRLAAALQERGIHCLVSDWRGLASSSVRAARDVDWSYLDLIDGEAQAMLALQRSALPQSRAHVLGHSLGGQVALMHAARYPQARPDSVLLVSSASPHYLGYPFPGRLAVLAFAWITALSTAALGVFPGDWLRFGGRQGASLMQEWSRFARSGRIPKLGLEQWDAEGALARCDVDIRALCPRGDTFAPESAVRELTAKVRGDHRFDRLRALPDGKPPGHFGWMREPDGVADWVRAQLG